MSYPLFFVCSYGLIVVLDCINSSAYTLYTPPLFRGSKHGYLRECAKYKNDRSIVMGIDKTKSPPPLKDSCDSSANKKGKTHSAIALERQTRRVGL